MFQPTFRITGETAKALMAIEADRQIVAQLRLTARVLGRGRRRRFVGGG